MKTAKLKRALAATGNGLLLATTAIHNTPIQARINEIDEEIEKLQEEKAELEERKISS